MEALQIMPIMAQNQSRLNLGEYAEEATHPRNQSFSFAVAKVVHFLEIPTIRSNFSSFLFSSHYTLHASHPSIALSHNRLRNLHMDYHFLLSGGKKHKFPILSGQYTTVTGLQLPIVANSSYK